MNFEEFLENDVEFDGDIITDNYEPEASFVWYSDSIEMTNACKNQFANILALPVELRDDELLYLDTSASDVADEELEEMLNEFVCAVAGFVSESEYERLFLER